MECRYGIGRKGQAVYTYKIILVERRRNPKLGYPSITKEVSEKKGESLWGILGNS